MATTMIPRSPKPEARARLGAWLLLGSLSLCAGLQGCAHPNHVVVQAGPAVRYAPAVLIEERGYAPAPGWSWLPGHWKWEGRDWVWVRGHWVQQQVPVMPALIVETRPAPPSAAHFWVPGHWVWRVDGHAGWFWIGGRWHS